jgi:hypothetical protein
MCVYRANAFATDPGLLSYIIINENHVTRTARSPLAAIHHHGVDARVRFEKRWNSLRAIRRAARSDRCGTSSIEPLQISQVTLETLRAGVQRQQLCISCSPGAIHRTQLPVGCHDPGCFRFSLPTTSFKSYISLVTELWPYELQLAPSLDSV